MKKEVLRLAWPAVASYILHNAYRINDQFWIQGLGGDAQAAVGTAFFVIILNFAALFLAAGGTLALVARAIGAGDFERAGSVTRHAILFAMLLAGAVGIPGAAFAGEITSLLGLEAAPARLAEEYLGTLYACLLPIALVPVLDNAFIGRGHTKIPMVLDSLAIGINYLLNPVLIYGGSAVATLGLDGGSVPPGAALADELARFFGVEAQGMRGAAIATASSRAVTSLLGLAILRFGFETSLVGSWRPKLARVLDIARLSAPVSMSIAVYSFAYLAIFSLVMAPLPTEVKAGLGLGFQVFEGLSFPCYLGVSIAGASLVGQRLGAKDEAGALEVVRATRYVGRIVGITMALAFLGAAPLVIPWFTSDPAVAAETLLYVRVLAFSQYFVSVETVNEKVLLGSGFTRPIPWIAGLGNVLRVPLAWLLASVLGFGAVGVWWSINATTGLKALLFWRRVEQGEWLTHLAKREAADAAS